MSYTTDLIPNLQGLIQDKADIKAAVAAKGVTVPDAAKLGDLPALIRQIETGGGGVELPALDNPAAATDIVSGKQAIDGNGNKLTGTYTPPTLTDLLPTLSNPATAADIASGKQAINAAGEVVTGTGNFVVKEEKTVYVGKQATTTTKLNGFPKVVVVQALENGSTAYLGVLLDPSTNSSVSVDYVTVKTTNSTTLTLSNSTGGSYYNVNLYIYY